MADDPRVIADQAIARAHAAVAATAMLQDQALLGGGRRSGIEIREALAGDHFIVSSGNFDATTMFSGIISPMSEGQKIDLEAELAEGRRKLDERRVKKEERRALRQGRFGRQSGQSTGGLPARGPCLADSPSQRVSPNPTTVSSPSGEFLDPPPPHLPPVPPAFNPNDPEFLRFLELKRQMGGCN